MKKAPSPSARPSGPRRSRRALLGGALGAAAPAAAAPPTSAPPNATADPVYRMLKRCTFGFDHAEYVAASNAGLVNWRDAQLNWQTIPELVPSTWEGWFPLLGWTPKQAYDNINGTSFDTVDQQQSYTVARALHSQRQLYEVLVERCTDHLNVNINENNHTRGTKPASDRDVMRPFVNAAHWSNLIRASARDPAMLEYLDNGISKCTSTTVNFDEPNENYARELLELHTMGVNGGYTEDDIENLAAILTGWSYKRDSNASDFGEYRYKAGLHCDGPKNFLNQPIPNPPAIPAGEAEGDAALDLILAHPSTRDHIASKMARWFLTENPPASHIANASAQFPDMKEMVRQLVNVAAFDDACVDDEPKYMRPFHFAIACCKTLKADSGLLSQNDTQGVRSIARWLNLFLNHQIQSQGSPAGWPDVAAYWAPQQKPRWDYALALVTNQVPGVTVDPDAVFAPVGTFDPNNPAPLVDTVVCMGKMTLHEKRQIHEFVTGYGGSLDEKKRYALAMALISPTFSKI